MRLKTISRKKWLFMVVLGLAAMAIGIPLASAEQSSITLKGSDVALCNKTDTDWTLSKGGVDNGDGTVTWTVTATKGDTNELLVVNGFMAVQNTGTAGATIGNIVVNLQQRVNSGTAKKPNWQWVTVSSDVADANSGDAATTANICSQASSEGLSSLSENPASGPLSFFDIGENDIWAISPQKTILPGGIVNLLFSAQFDNSILLIQAGDQIRAEVIVSFGNSGSRSDKSSCQNVDINGNLSVDSDEAYVRSVPTRITKVVPALNNCNSTVKLKDTGVTTTGTVTYSGLAYVPDIGYPDGDGVPITDTTTFTVTASNVDGGASGGQICNTATLKGENCSVSVIIGYDEVTNPDGSTLQVPIYYDFPCCVGVDLSKEACVTIGPASTGITAGDFCTYARTDYGNGYNSTNGSPTALQTLLKNNFPPSPPGDPSPAFPNPNNLTIGYGTNGDGSLPYSAKWTYAGVYTTGSSASCTGLICYLHLQAGGNSTAFTADTTEATSTSGGKLAGQVATLAVNVGLGAARKMPVNLGSDGDIGELTLCNLVAGTMINSSWALSAGQASLLNGKSISDVLADANTTLGDGNVCSNNSAIVCDPSASGGAIHTLCVSSSAQCVVKTLPAYVGSAGNLSDLAEQLNAAFPGTGDLSSCGLSTWATDYLCK